MLKPRLFALAFAGLSVVSVSRAVVIVENFSTDPLSHGWQVFGETNLFSWNAGNQNLEVTWDSSRPNSYFYQELGTQFTRHDNLSMEFDLQLADIASGVEPDKTGPLQIGFGFLNFTDATSTNFMRGAWGSAPNVAELDYYPSGYYDSWDIVSTTTPSFISGVNSFHYAPAFLDVYEYELPLNQTVHVRLDYDGLSQRATVTLTTNGVPLTALPALALGSSANSQFTAADDFRVDMFSISSYSSSGDDYDSVLAHGTVANLVVTASLQPIGRLGGEITSNGTWQAQFFCHSNWLYTLERTADFKSWTQVSATMRGIEGSMVLQDTNALSTKSFYRVRAE